MFKATFSGPENFAADFKSAEFLAADFTDQILVPVGEAYRGEYEITPTDVDQTLSIEGKIAVRDIIVRAVPNDRYGRLSWNGAYLAVY